MNDIALAALSARYWVRAGLDPRTDCDDALAASLRPLLHARGVGLTPRERAVLAVAGIRGYLDSRPQPRTLRPIRYRLMPDGTRVYLTATPVGTLNEPPEEGERSHDTPAR